MESKIDQFNNVEYWIACSGGLDSVCLVYLLNNLKKNIGILHCNFKLRGEESDGDEVFVRNLAQQLNIPIQVSVFDVDSYKKATKTNTQLAARELRYNWFNEVKQKYSAKIVLGHHRDDQRETFLLQLMRGASVNGLAAMPLNRNGYIRPLLGYTKKQLLQIAHKNKWSWREDSSNQLDDYARNDLRINLLPLLEKNDVELRLIDELILGYQELHKQVENTKLQIGVGDYQISLLQWENLPVIYQKTLLEDLGFGKNNHDLVLQIVQSNKGAFALQNDVELWNEGNYLLFKRSIETKKIPKLIITPVQKEDIDFSVQDLFIDGDKVKGVINLRYWTDGDEFSPLGLQGVKKVSDFLKDKKVRSSDKKKQLVLCDRQGIIGVVGFVPSNRVKITAATKHFFRLSVES